MINFLIEHEKDSEKVNSTFSIFNNKLSISAQELDKMLSTFKGAEILSTELDSILTELQFNSAQELKEFIDFYSKKQEFIKMPYVIVKHIVCTALEYKLSVYIVDGGDIIIGTNGYCINTESKTNLKIKDLLLKEEYNFNLNYDDSSIGDYVSLNYLMTLIAELESDNDKFNEQYNQYVKSLYDDDFNYEITEFILKLTSYLGLKFHIEYDGDFTVLGKIRGIRKKQFYDYLNKEYGKISYTDDLINRIKSYYVKNGDVVKSINYGIYDCKFNHNNILSENATNPMAMAEWVLSQYFL